MDTEKTDNSIAPATQKMGWRRAVVATSVLGGMLFSGAVVLPVAVMKTAYRDSVLNARLEKFGLTAESGSGSGSWFTPIEFKDVRISDESGRLRLDVKTLSMSKSLAGYLVNRGDLGRVAIVQPTLTATLDENGSLPLKVMPGSSVLDKLDVQFDVQNAAMVLKADYREIPYIDLKHIDINGAITTTEKGRWLTIDSTKIFDHESLTELHTEQNLALIAPVLSQSTSLTGQVSVNLEPVRIRLDDDSASPLLIRGTAVFHAVDARLKSQWVSAISQMLGRVAGKNVPDRLQITRDSAVAFSVDSKGIRHHGMVFLLPDMAMRMQIESSGIVGLDETLDLVLALQLPQIAPSGPVMSVLAKMVSNPFQLQIKGTVTEPQLVTPPGFSLVDQLSLNVAPETYTDEPQRVSSAVMELIRNVSSSKPGTVSEELPGGILGLIRSIQKAKQDAPPTEKPARRKKKRNRNVPQKLEVDEPEVDESDAQ